MDSHLKELVRQRRRIALAYRRSQSDGNRRRLEIIDRELSGYNIDIPGIQHLVAHRKTGNRDPSHPAPQVSELSP